LKGQKPKHAKPTPTLRPKHANQHAKSKTNTNTKTQYQHAKLKPSTTRKTKHLQELVVRRAGAACDDRHLVCIQGALV
jgi:hypothetical protein